MEKYVKMEAIAYFVLEIIRYFKFVLIYIFPALIVLVLLIYLYMRIAGKDRLPSKIGFICTWIAFVIEFFIAMKIGEAGLEYVVVLGIIWIPSMTALIRKYFKGMPE